jgi:hypothetical protein
MTMTMISDDDVRMVADRLGLKEDDVEDIRDALDDVQLLGFQAFVDQVLVEGAKALEAARAGEQPTEAVVRRTMVRGRIAHGLAEMIDLRDQLARYDGPEH